MICKIIERLELSYHGIESPVLRDEIEKCWKFLVDEKKIRSFFPSCGPSWSVESWWRQMVRDRSTLAVCSEKMYRDRPLGFVVLAGVRPRRAFFHFAWSYQIGPALIQASTWVCDKILEDFRLQVLIGMIPENNGKAIRLAELVGFRASGRILFGSWINTLQQSIDTTIWCYINPSAPAKSGGHQK